MDSGPKADRYTAIAGVTFVVLWFVATIVTRFGFLDSGSDIAADFADGSGLILAMSWLGSLSVVAMMWFMAGIASAMQRSGESRLAMVGVGGAVAGSAATAGGFALLMVAALRANDAGGLDSVYAAALQDGGLILIGWAAPVGFAAFVLAVAVGVLRTGRMAPWFGWLSAAIGVVLLVPFIAFLAMYVFLLWILYVCYVVYTGNGVTPESVATGVGSGGAVGAVSSLADTGTAPRSVAPGSMVGAEARGPQGAGSHDIVLDGSMPKGYPIKGNVDSMLYHRADSYNYGATIAEVWFDTAGSAEGAGFSLAKTHPSGSSDAGPYGSGSHAVAADGSMPDGYGIKGNVDSMLYHRTDSYNYGATVAEVWFDTAGSAEAAGFTLAKTHPKSN